MIPIYNFKYDFDEYKLPNLFHSKYNDIENFENYEISNCVAYELAIRNSNFQKRVIEYDNFLLELDKAIIKTRETRDMAYVENLYFDKQIFYDLGFDDYAIDYYKFRKEAGKIDKLQNLSHLDLCDFCLKNKFKTESLDEKIQLVIQKYNHNFHRETFQGISCRYMKKYLDAVNYEIHEVNIRDGYFNDMVNDEKLASISNINGDPFIKKEGLYSYPTDDEFDLSPVEYQTMSDNILPTISLLYKRPPLSIVTNNKHIYAEINLKLSDEEIIENIKRILEIKKTREASLIHRNILDSSNMFFKDYVEHEKPKKTKKKNLQKYYKNLIYVYDTFLLFDRYCLDINKKFEEGMLLLVHEDNKFNTYPEDRKKQKNELINWKNNMIDKKRVYDLLYVELTNNDYAPSGTHMINDMLTVAKKLIDEEEYKFLI